MIYLVKTLYMTLLLPPGIFIVMLLALAVWAMRYSRRMAEVMLGTTLLLYLASSGFVADPLIRSLETRYLPPADIKGDVIIVLGGGATADTPNVNGVGHVYGSSANRLLTAAQLYQKLRVPLIVSGGKVFEATGVEADIQKTILVGLGVPAEKIFTEDQSRNTTENALFSSRIMVREGLADPILVTSAYHMARAVGQFNKAGVAVTPYPTDFQANIHGGISLVSFIPLADSLGKTEWALKEYLGLAALRWY